MADPIVFGLDPGTSEATAAIAPATKATILTSRPISGLGAHTTHAYPFT